MKTVIHKLEALLELGGTTRDISFLAMSGVSLIVSMFDLIELPFDAAWVAILLCGIPIILEAAIGMITAFDIKADLLVSMALIAAICIGEDFAAGEVAFIMQLGGLMEELTVAKARAGIEKLVHLTPQTARVLAEGGEQVIPAEQVRVGDRIRVLPGETVPVDGVITLGSTAINQAVMTGESLPVDKTLGDSVSSGTVNQFGAFEMEARKVGQDSSIQRMIRLVQSADAGKAKIVGLADKWATWIVIIALTAAAITWAVTGEIIRAVTILVVFCPCAMVLATPTAIMAAIGNATRHGFLVREGDALERLAGVSHIAFDKTGTLTCGTPRVVAVRSLSGLEEQEIFRMAAAVERNSEHPLGKAIVRDYGEQDKRPLPEAVDFEMVPGRWVSAILEGQQVQVGKLLNGSALSGPAARQVEADLNTGATLVYVTVAGTAAGYLVLSDTLREHSAHVVEQLKSLQAEPVLLTGDNASAANAIGGSLGIREIRANCLPEDKLQQIADYQARNQMVCMIGDGINDAPALKKAYVGIAMGGVGSDIAVDAADIALINDDIRELPHLLALSRRMTRTIHLNLTFSMALNLLAITLAITGLMGPVIGALVHNTGSVLVIINSAFLLHWSQK